ncbi:Pre-rRNA-processing protein TSR1 [Chionoecetes opilio]|uniref:Pre-rRNA-processing protein TSR1 n=1 Tax=Chionoecetes opilio TaxID=41210 RepID=A0A8J4YMU1_CHIOP|nr:Pre-rRNA-processing protein TSR1 [Chionoecetes opilio]
MAQGLPTPVHVVTDLEEVSQKSGSVGREMETETLEQDLGTKLSLKPPPSPFRPHRKHQLKQNLAKEIEVRFPGPAKLHTVATPQDALLVLRHIGAQKQRPVFFRDNRPHIMAEKIEFIPEGVTGTLRVHGYLRGQPLSVNSLVHMPGWGEYQMSAIHLRADPFPLDRRGKGGAVVDEELSLVEEADVNVQESLISTNEVRSIILFFFIYLFFILFFFKIFFFFWIFFRRNKFTMSFLMRKILVEKKKKKNLGVLYIT